MTWDACSKKVCGAERVGWEPMDLKGIQNSGGATTLVVDLATAFEKGSAHCRVEKGDVFWLVRREFQVYFVLSSRTHEE